MKPVHARCVYIPDSRGIRHRAPGSVTRPRYRYDTVALRRAHGETHVAFSPRHGTSYGAAEAVGLMDSPSHFELIPMFCIVLSMLLIDVLAIGLVVISVVHEILVLTYTQYFFCSSTKSRPGPICETLLDFEKRLEFHAEFCVIHK